ncbi:MAG: hypothetical protein H0U69_16470 [Trueperaceae bacterium]|nr:hypothetical protein [Trueperaceae bacterium]
MLRLALLPIALPIAALLVASAVGQPLPRAGVLAPSMAAEIAFVLPDGMPAIVDGASGLVTPLAQGAMQASFPSWSPDGDRVAYTSLTSGRASVDVVALRPAHASAGSPSGRVLAAPAVSVYGSRSDAPIYVSWSPAGDRLAILAVDVDGLALYLADADGGGSTLFSRGNPFFWSWDGAGERLLVHRDVLGVAPLVGFTALAGFDVTYPFPDPGVFQTPALSAGERFVAYATRTMGDTRRVVMTEARAFAPEPGPDVIKRELPHAGQAAIAWHPHLDVLAIQRGEPNGFGSLALLYADSGDLVVLVEGGSLAYFWAPDGGSIAYLTLDWGGPGLGPERRVLSLVQERDLPRLALKVVDVFTGLSEEIAIFEPTRSFVEQFLPFFDQYARSHRVWSPASDALVFSVLGPDGVGTVTRFGLDGSVTPLSQGEMPSYNVR